MQRELDGLVDRLRERIRLRRYSLRTEQAYVDWVRRFARFHRQRSSSELTADDAGWTASSARSLPHACRSC